MPRTPIADTYLQALAIEGVEPTSARLSAITTAHVGTLAFASIGPRLGDRLPLDPDSLLDRIVTRRRGGYCFEQNGLLDAVLTALGYRTRILLARVILHGDPHPGLTHRVTLVEVEGRQLVADVGFGPLGPPRPVPLPGHGTGEDDRFRVVEDAPGEFHMQRVVDGAFVSLYRFELSRYGQSDCELGHFYSHRHPGASFVNNLVASRILPDETRSLRNREYWVIRPDGEDRTPIEDADQLRALLTGELGLRVSPDECRRLFAQVRTG